MMRSVLVPGALSLVLLGCGDEGGTASGNNGSGASKPVPFADRAASFEADWLDWEIDCGGQTANGEPLWATLRHVDTTADQTWLVEAMVFRPATADARPKVRVLTWTDNGDVVKSYAYVKRRIVHSSFGTGEIGAYDAEGSALFRMASPRGAVAQLVFEDQSLFEVKGARIEDNAGEELINFNDQFAQFSGIKREIDTRCGAV